MPIIPIINLDDSRIEAYTSLRERDIVGRNQQFIAEGRVVIKNLMDTSIPILSFLISEKQKGFMAEIPERIRESVPIYITSQNIMDQIVGFPIHRGILALGQKPLRTPFEQFLSTLPPDVLLLALIGLTNHDNIGSIFRNAAAFGCSGILLDPTCCDPFYRKAIRVSVGGVFKVPFYRIDDPLSEIEIFRSKGFHSFSLSPSGTSLLRELPKKGKNIFFLGTEGNGLPLNIMEQTTSIQIPIVPGFDSLNVAATSAIVLYELFSS